MPPSFAVPPTARTSRMASSTTKQALAMIKGVSPSVCRFRNRIAQLDKGLQQSITENEIGDHLYQKFRQSAAKKGHTNFALRKWLTEVRVITTEKVLRLKKVRESANAEKAAKSAAWEEKKRLKELQAKAVPVKGSGKGKKSVTISKNITVHTLSQTMRQRK